MHVGLRAAQLKSVLLASAKTGAVAPHPIYAAHSVSTSRLTMLIAGEHISFQYHLRDEAHMTVSTCGTTCGSTQVCTLGECKDRCSGLTPDLCGSSCVNKQTDDANCGQVSPHLLLSLPDQLILLPEPVALHVIRPKSVLPDNARRSVVV